VFFEELSKVLRDDLSHLGAEEVLLQDVVHDQRQDVGAERRLQAAQPGQMSALGSI
jgi:hypothetical protein